MAFAAVIAAIGIGIKALNDYADKQRNKDKYALENATKAAEELKNQYNELKSAYEEFKDTINGYEDIKNGLNDITKGTQEYRDSIREDNEKALQLIKSHKELSGQYSINEDGLIVFKQNALENAQNAQSKKVAQAQAASYGAEAAKLEAENQYNQTGSQ